MVCVPCAAAGSLALWPPKSSGIYNSSDALLFAPQPLAPCRNGMPILVSNRMSILLIFRFADSCFLLTHLCAQVLYTEVLQHYPDEYVGDDALAPEGVRVHGFHLRKASWDLKRGVMCRLDPGHVGGAEMPVVLLKVSLYISSV